MDMDARSQAEAILRAAGVDMEAISAKRKIDLRLDAVGLPASTSAPFKIFPGKSAGGLGLTGLNPSMEQRMDQLMRRATSPAADEGRAVTAILLGDGVGAQPPRVVPAQDIPLTLGEATWEPTDLAAAQAVASLATTASGGTEIKFNDAGIVYVGSGAMGCYWARALGANINSKWSPLMAGQRFSYHPQSGLFFGTNTIGGVAAKGVLTLCFYKMPAHYDRNKNDSWKQWHKQIGEWTEGAGGENATGAVLMSLSSGPANGTDVTLGTFSDAGGGTQIFKVGTNFPVGGAITNPGAVIYNASSANTDAIWVAETAALAIASNGGIFPAGQDVNNRAVGTKLFMLANSGTQVLGARYRS